MRKRAALSPLNGYLGAALRPGAHTYEFVFRPTSAFVGMAISGFSLALCLGLIIAARRDARRATRGPKQPVDVAVSTPDAPTP